MEPMRSVTNEQLHTTSTSGNTPKGKMSKSVTESERYEYTETVQEMPAGAKAELYGTAEDIAAAIAENEPELCERCGKAEATEIYQGLGRDKNVCHDCAVDCRMEE